MRSKAQKAKETEKELDSIEKMRNVSTINFEYVVKVLGWATIQSLRSDVIITIAEFLNGRKFVIGNQMLDVWPKAYRLIT